MANVETASTNTSSTRSVTPPSPQHMRRAMGTFATGVTVVTGYNNDTPVGFACQSFASLSLEPPLVLFCVDHRSRSWSHIRDSGRFCVNILDEQQTDLCERFGSSRGVKFDGLDWELSQWGSPTLPDVLTRVHAEVYDVHVAGDHNIVIGQVLELETREDGQPMLFFRGRFELEPDPGPVPYDVWRWGDHWL